MDYDWMKKVFGYLLIAIFWIVMVIIFPWLLIVFAVFLIIGCAGMLLQFLLGNHLD